MARPWDLLPLADLLGRANSAAELIETFCDSKVGVSWYVSFGATIHSLAGFNIQSLWNWILKAPIISVQVVVYVLVCYPY